MSGAGIYYLGQEFQVLELLRQELGGDRVQHTYFLLHYNIQNPAIPPLRTGAYEGQENKGVTAHVLPVGPVVPHIHYMVISPISKGIIETDSFIHQQAEYLYGYLTCGAKILTERDTKWKSLILFLSRG